MYLLYSRSAGLVVPDSLIPTPAKLGPRARLDMKPEDLIASFLQARGVRTRRIYAQDLDHFAKHLGRTSPAEAIASLLVMPQGEAHAVVSRYRDDMSAHGYAPATVNRRIATLRSIVTTAQTFGLVPWALKIKGVRSKRFRDTRGPGKEGFLAMIRLLESRSDPASIRNTAILRLLFDLALRRSEVCGLDIGHVGFDSRRIWILGKGDVSRVPLSLPDPTYNAIVRWLRVHPLLKPLVPKDPGRLPLFVALAGPYAGHRLTPDSVWRIVVATGLEAGIGHVRPHGLRHAAITTALDATRGDVRSVQRFARHRNPATTMQYDDSKDDLAGRVAGLVSSSASGNMDNGRRS